MKTLLVGINAKYSHTNLAIRYLRNSLIENNIEALIFESSINDRKQDIIRKLFESSANIFCFSCYIWNIDFVLNIAKDIKTILPQSKVILGGPEVSYNADEIIAINSFIDCIVCGEGEEILPEIINDLSNNKNIEKVIFANLIDEKDIISPYLINEISKLKDKIIYFETSRGCPYNCSYCLSGGKGGLRFRDINEVKNELLQIINEGAKLIKFVDRSFNCNQKRAYELFSFLKDINTDATFHFEICANLLREQDFLLLSQVKKGKFQFEIGIQSINDKTLHAIDRKFDINLLINNTKKLKQQNNIHIHCDLIAGLPYEDINSFKNSFNKVYTICDVLQLGFLKVLNGSLIKDQVKEYGIIYSANAPYEIFSNKWLCYEDVLSLKKVEQALNKLSNSKAFVNTIKYLLNIYNSAFNMFFELANYLNDRNALFCNVSRKSEFTLLYDFAISKGIKDNSFYEYLRLDFVSSMKGEPPFPYDKYEKGFYNKCNEFFGNAKNIEKYIPQYINLSPKNIHKNCFIHCFNFEYKLILLFDRISGKIIDISDSEQIRIKDKENCSEPS